MEKPFWEVFPELKTDNRLNELLNRVLVDKVTISRDRSSLHIYMESPALIGKDDIYAIEDAISSQLFAGDDLSVKIMEKFNLPALYTPEKIVNEYMDSLLTEFKRMDSVSYNMLRRAGISFLEGESGKVMLRLEDNIAFREHADGLSRQLESIFSERFGLTFKVGVEFCVKAEKNNDHAFGDNARAVNVSEKIGGSAGPEANAPAKGGTSKDRPGKNFSRSKRLPDDKDIIYGRPFEGSPVDLIDVDDSTGQAVFRGQIISYDTRDLKNEKRVISLAITDMTDSITVKLFLNADDEAALRDDLAVGKFITLKGTAVYDKYDGEITVGSVSGIRKTKDFTDRRIDSAPVKRVELHCHTKMSDMDGVTDVTDYIKRAAEWEMPAIAITDHGGVQAFPDAAHAKKPEDLKVIYGMEGFLVDDILDIVSDPHGQTFDDPYVVVDIETIGLSPVRGKIIEIGAVRLEGGEISDRFNTFVNPEVSIPAFTEELTGINDLMVAGAPTIEEVLPKFLDFAKDAVFVAHNASFDYGFLSLNAKLLGLEYDPSVVDTLSLSRVLLPNLARFGLDRVVKALGITLEHHHRAVDDAEATALVFIRFIKMLKEDHDITDLDGVKALEKADTKTIMKLPTHHVSILAKNDTGRINLYRIVSASHLDYYSGVAKIPRSLLNEYREGLLIGSACRDGELYDAVSRDESQEELTRMGSFYDYFEIQPVANSVRISKNGDNVTSEDVIYTNKKIVELGDMLGKPVCATGDVHFLDPEDRIYRQILRDPTEKHRLFEGNEDAPMYLRTTDEMLEEFSYLGSDKAYEVVVTNTRMIADMCEPISPLRPDKCPPVIENSEEELRTICYDKAHEMYGDDLPRIVVDRLEKELTSIISNGYAFMYIIAHRLVKKSNEDGYLVGSRGSVGSSFVARMAGISEVNPLPPHYYCTGCHYSDFDSDDVKAYASMAGCDMPDKVCPVCGKPLMKDGFNIPFETFLGYRGDKEPDIDLNFSGDYQSRAHELVEEIFGKGHTFRAGTIGTLADKTAYKYVLDYCEHHDILKRKPEINRLVQGLVGVRRTTGQHPGGIVVLPHGEIIDSFTPVQHPADDMTSKIVTTHFDYHSIDHNLLKLDILGKDDPTEIRMLQDLTGIDPIKDIPLDSKAVMSLFQDTSALGVTPEDIGGCRLGTLGIPEFGTDFAMQMLIDTKPNYLSDLVRIAGLAHGTDVWVGNAQKLILDGTATIQTAICTRDDIMTYLIDMGLEKELAFTIMESVRKGRGLKPEWESEMLSHGVPDWYIWSCNRIKYMFPKAHAAAYVMMAWRIAYFKIYYPLAFYAAYFSIKATGFTYELMCMGRDKLERCLADYRSRSDSLSKKEQDTLRDMRIVQEMYARGYSFEPIDIYTAGARKFKITEDGKLMPSINSIDGLGEAAADAIEESSKDGPFLSKEDFINRTKVSRTICDQLEGLGILSGLPETNQLSLFDLF